MFGEFADTIFIGCATDRNYLLPTCAMLSSLDDNGSVPEATVIVASFDLSPLDCAKLRDSAGRLGQSMRFLPLTRTSVEIVAVPRYDFPFPLIGRMVIPREIKEARARLVLLDSDMIVNGPIRPLFEMSMRGRALAAVHDPIAVREHWGREPDDEYFNAGLMMIDIDRFNADDLGAQAMHKLASYDVPPRWLDQDVLNDLLGREWLTLDRRWNYFHAADARQFTIEDYQQANVIHFAGPKPWLNSPHPAASLYFHHAARAEKKMTWHAPKMQGGWNSTFAAMSYEILLGRELEAQTILTERAHLSPIGLIASVVQSPEFYDAVFNPVRRGEQPLPGRFPGTPSLVQKSWIIDNIPLLRATAGEIAHAKSWRELLAALFSDQGFARLTEAS